MVGAHVCNLSVEDVEINFFKKIDKNMFFAMERQQLRKEIRKLLGLGGM